MALYNYKVII